MPNQYCHAVTKLILGWFVGGIFWQETSNLNDPYIFMFACAILLMHYIITFLTLGCCLCAKAFVVQTRDISFGG